MNQVVSASIALSVSAVTLGALPVYATNINSHDTSLDFSQMFVFGDSLSEIGNAFSLSEGKFPENPLSFEGRFSNGPIWIESLASSLDLNLTAFFTGAVSPDGANYATGGSLSGNQNIFNGFPLGLEQQIGSFIAPVLATSQSANSDALYTVWAGANDYLFTPANTDTTVKNISNAVASLYDVGARNFLIPNLPSLGSTPLATFTNTSDKLNQLTDEHNQKLESAILELNQSLPGVSISLLKVNSILDEIFENPSQFGLTNVTDSWSNTVLTFCPDAFLGADGSLESCDENIPNPDEYLFWDTIHPTQATHQVLANEALDALTSDFTKVPEPLTILGTVTALGFGALFKKKVSSKT